MSVLARFPVERISPNEQVRETILVAAHDPTEAREIASEDGEWFVARCGRALWDSPADYGKPRIVSPVQS